MNSKKMPRSFVVFWSIISIAYLIWMICMKDTILITFETTAAKTVDGVLFENISGFENMHWAYPLWVLISTVSLILFPVYSKLILYNNKSDKFIKYWTMILLVFDTIFVTWYALMGDRYTITEKLRYVTSSMLGLDYPWHFRMWGIFSSAAMFTATMFAYKRNNFNSKVGYFLCSIGAAGIYMTINLPSIGENADFSNPRCLWHWLGALLFAFCGAAPSGIMFYKMMRKHIKYYTYTFFAFITVVIVMTVLLITVGKSAFIENLPIWIVYIHLFLINYTNVYSPEKISSKYLSK